MIIKNFNEIFNCLKFQNQFQTENFIVTCVLPVSETSWQTNLVLLFENVKLF